MLSKHILSYPWKLRNGLETGLLEVLMNFLKSSYNLS